MATIDIAERNALFLHIPKTAGWSVTSALQTAFPDAGVYPSRGIRSPKVGAAAHMAHRLGPDRLARRWTFCMIRNPWDWTVSGWIHVVRNKPAYDDPPTFRDFVLGAWRTGATRNPHPKKYVDGSVFVAYHTQVTQDGHLRVGWRRRLAPIAFDARFERLQDDWTRICERLGTDIHLPHRNRSDRDDYSSYYDDETREIVARRNAPLIERFGYRFGE